MLSSRTVFLNMTKKFPEWMDVNKRPKTSVAGKYLQSVIEENDSVKIALDEFKSDFFLVSYFGREDTVLSKAYIYRVGNIADDIEMVSPALKVTTDSKLFVKNRADYVLLQLGYIIIAPESLPEDGKCIYKYADNTYGGKLIERPLWNIFDEYALFLGLIRYKDESNKDLMKRCLLVFKNRTNSSEEGLKNAICNAVSTRIAIDKDDIIFEKPDEKNLAIADDDFETLYERLAQFNHDAFRNKQWDMDTWEHNFKKLDWVPHVWDAPVSIYQDGTGQNDDLKVYPVSKDDGAKTNVEVYGYKKSFVMAEEYVRKRSISCKIPMKLKQYKDQPRVLDVNYKVTAEPAIKIEPHTISLVGKKKFRGEYTYKLSDIMQESGNAIEEHLGMINNSGYYDIRFTPKTKFSPINISRVITTNRKTERNLRKEKKGFEIDDDGILHNVSNALHIEKLTDASSFSGMQDTIEGMKIAPHCSEGEIVIDVINNQGEAIYIGHTGILSDISESDAIKSRGFKYENGKYKASMLGFTASMDIDTDCACFEFEFLPPDDGEQQGSANVKITIDNIEDTISSGVWTNARKYSRQFDRLTHVQVHIEKASTSPISFGNIKSAAYDIKYSFDHGIPDSTPQAILTPETGEQKNSMHIQVKAYDANSPIIKYIHIGDTTEKIAYEIKDTYLRGNTWLEIDSNCNVELILNKNDEKETINKDFKTGILYKNTTEQTIHMAIDLSDIESIESSSVTINKTTYKGNVTSYISLAPGEEISEISIVGTGFAAARNYALDKLLGIVNDKETNEEVYVSHSVGGFIVKNTKTDSERITRIEKAQVDKECTQFILDGLPDGVTGQFFISENNSIKGDSISKPFSYFYLIASDIEQSIGYGSKRMVRQAETSIPLPSFYPALEDARLYVYQIDLGTGLDSQSVQVDFEKNYDSKQVFESWSLGQKEYGIVIRVNFDLENVTSYESEEQKVNDYYIVATKIQLKDTFGEDSDYACYIVEPPDGMEVNYESHYTEDGEPHTVKEDGFNKLYYAMVLHIDKIEHEGSIIPPDEYSVISDGGILVWNTDKYVGEDVRVYYTFNKPVSLEYTSVDALYDIIGYNIEALTLMNKVPVVIEDMTDGEYKDIVINGELPDNMLAFCNNSDFQASVYKNRITISHVGAETSNNVKTGYYYDQGREFYFFEHKHKEIPVIDESIKTEDAELMDGEFIFSQPTNNFLLDCSMDGDRLDTAAHFDIHAHSEIDGISRLGAITACDSFHKWTSLDMDIELTGTNSNRKLRFKPLNKLSYALVEITNGVSKNALLSYSFEGSLNGTVMKEVLAGTDSMRKSVFCSYYGKVKAENGIASFVFDDSTDESCRYFLMLNGEGTIDDIILKQYDKDEDISKLHTRNIEAMYFGVEEVKPEHYMETISFDINNNVLSDAEITSDGTIRTGSNVDYGVTKIFDSRNDMDKIFNDDSVFIRKTTELYSEDSEGKITITGIPVPNYTSAKDVYVKINDVSVKGLNNFDVRIETSEYEEYNYHEVRFVRKTNLAPAYSVALSPYIQIEIKVPAKSVITNVEIYVRYAESGRPLSVGISNHGRLISKVYDTLFSGNYKPARIDGTVEKFECIRLFIRGCRINSIGEAVWTDWYRYELDKDLMIVGNPHIFDGYRLFQFRVNIDSPDVRLNIKNFIFEVI